MWCVTFNVVYTKVSAECDELATVYTSPDKIFLSRKFVTVPQTEVPLFLELSEFLSYTVKDKSRVAFMPKRVHSICFDTISAPTVNYFDDYLRKNSQRLDQKCYK